MYKTSVKRPLVTVIKSWYIERKDRRPKLNYLIGETSYELYNK